MLFRVSLLLVSLSLAAATGQGNMAKGSKGSSKSSSAKGSSKSKGSKGNSGNGVRGSGGATGVQASGGVEIGGIQATGLNSQRVPLTLPVRSFDGAEDLRSAVDAELIRVAGPPTYPDGLGNDFSMETEPNARGISNIVAQVPAGVTLERSRVSDMLWQWGQFMDHDIGLTEGLAEPFVIMSPDCESDSICTIDMQRALHHFTDGVREQLNEITGFLDASMVYGHTDERAAALREFVGGRLKMTDEGLLPDNEPNIANAFPSNLGFNVDDAFLGGDIRVNEQIGLLAIHTLWVREHNKIADLLTQSFPLSGDEDVYQMARKLVTAEIQAITYKEFLPNLIGEAAPNLDDYDGFDDQVNPGIAQEFSAVAFRVGHTFLSESLMFHNQFGQTGSINLMDAFFTPGLVRESPNLIDEVLIGQTVQAANMADVFVIEEVRSLLFGAPVSGVGRDLVAFNIQRARDHGIVRYNAMRAGYGLPTKDSFSEVTSDANVAQALSLAYGGNITLCDPWICGLAEDAVGGGELGEMFSRIIGDQFQRLMDGDIFFYLNDPDVRAEEILNIGIDVDRVTLADVINRNTVGGVGPEAMVA